MSTQLAFNKPIKTPAKESYGVIDTTLQNLWPSKSGNMFETQRHSPKSRN